MACIETVCSPLQCAFSYTPQLLGSAHDHPSPPHHPIHTQTQHKITPPLHTHAPNIKHNITHPTHLIPHTQKAPDACQEICIWPAIPARKHPPSPSERDRREKEGKVGGSRDGGSKRGRYLIKVDSTGKHRIYAFRFNGKVVAVQKPILFPKRAGVSQKIGLCASCVRHHKALRLHAMRESYPLFGAHTQQRRVK